MYSLEFLASINQIQSFTIIRPFQEPKTFATISPIYGPTVLTFYYEMNPNVGLFILSEGTSEAYSDEDIRLLDPAYNGE